MRKRTLIISDVDHERLESLVNWARMHSIAPEQSLAALESELRRARIVSVGMVPPDVVTMNSIVRLRDVDLDETDEYELVYPVEADITQNRVSVLAPIGTAILGYRVDDVIKWAVPAGVRRIRVEEVLRRREKIGA